MQLLIRKQQESAPLHGLQHSLAEKNPERRKSRAAKAHERERESARTANEGRSASCAALGSAPGKKRPLFVDEWIQEFPHFHPQNLVRMWTIGTLFYIHVFYTVYTIVMAPCCLTSWGRFSDWNLLSMVRSAVLKCKVPVCKIRTGCRMGYGIWLFHGSPHPPTPHTQIPCCKK